MAQALANQANAKPRSAAWAAGVVEGVYTDLEAQASTQKFLSCAYPRQLLHAICSALAAAGALRILWAACCGSHCETLNSVCPIIRVGLPSLFVPTA